MDPILLADTGLVAHETSRWLLAVVQWEDMLKTKEMKILDDYFVVETCGN